jgi:hypothetical protein
LSGNSPSGPIISADRFSSVCGVDSQEQMDADEFFCSLLEMLEREGGRFRGLFQGERVV